MTARPGMAQASHQPPRFRINQPWVEDALCAKADPELFFPATAGASYREAKTVCYQCPVRAQCLNYALNSNEGSGCWGGMSENERKWLRRGRRDAQQGRAV